MAYLAGPGTLKRYKWPLGSLNNEVELRSVEKLGKVNSGCWAVLPGPCNPPPYPHLNQRATVIEPFCACAVRGPRPRGLASASSKTHAQNLSFLKPFNSLYLDCACLIASLFFFFLRYCARAEDVSPGPLLGAESGPRARQANGDPPNVRRDHALSVVSSDRRKGKGRDLAAANHL